MRSKSNSFKTPSYTSPKGGTRGCLCADGTYSVKCCDGSLQAQGIGNIYGVRAVVIDYFLLQENGDTILQENGDNILTET